MRAVIQPQTRLPLDQAPLKKLEFLLGANRDQLSRLADWKQNYAPFEQTKPPKPHSKKAGASKLRHIDNPKDELKQIQTRILKKLLLPVRLPGFLFGAVPRRSITDHAKAHIGASTVVKMDIKSYYPNLTNIHVYKVWSEVLRCSPPVAELLTKLTTCDYHLPQGAPTSPALANLFLSSIYGPVLEACSKEGVVVTAWVDDLTFSGVNARGVMETVRRTLAANGFKDSRKKRIVLGPRNMKIITGVRLGKDGPRACRLKVREIRAGIFNLKLQKATSRGIDKDIQSLQGKIAHIRSVCPEDAVRLELQIAKLINNPVQRPTGTLP